MGGVWMARWGIAAIALALVPQVAAADALDATQRLGQRLFTQSCAVCHLKPAITAKRYGPALSKDLVSGQEPAMADFIRQGTPHMPGFRYQFTAAEIDAIVQYLKTVPAPADEAKPAGSTRGPVD